MKTLRLFIISLLIVACGRGMPPNVSGSEDAELLRITHEYIDLANINGISFTHNPFYIGFENIQRARTIGVCYFRIDSRRVGIDFSFWLEASEKTKKVLVFHELTHCLCGRDHDFGDGLMYMSDKARQIAKDMGIFVNSGDGYFKDGCPTSIMHPTMLTDFCIEKHEQKYLKEMFNRCNPW